MLHPVYPGAKSFVSHSVQRLAQAILFEPLQELLQELFRTWVNDREFDQASSGKIFQGFRLLERLEFAVRSVGMALIGAVRSTTARI